MVRDGFDAEAPMSVPLRHVVHQGPVLAAIGRAGLSALRQRLPIGRAPAAVVPGPTLTATLPPRDPALVRDYIRWTGGDPAAYKGRLPPHLFPQWGFPLQGRTLAGIPYPLTRVLNGGCKLTIHADLPADRPLDLEARLESIDDDGRRAVLRQRLVTRIDGVDRLTAEFFAIVPLGGGDKGAKGAKRKAKKPATLVPRIAREIGWWRLDDQAGLTFACLTGDFNPVHWVPAYARAAGFRHTILHGFATLARTLESMNRVLWAGDTRRVGSIDVRFTKPLVLPARVGCYVHGDEVFVGDAPGAPAYLAGRFTAKEDA